MIDNPVQTQLDPNSDQFKYLRLIYLLFEKSDSGKELLDMWKKHYLFSPCVVQGFPEYPFIREGENKVIRSIMSDIKRFEMMMEDKNGSS